MRNLYIAPISYDFKIEMIGMKSIIATLMEVSRRGWQASLWPFCGYSILPAARNSVVSLFLDSKCTDLIMVDCDESWAADAICKLAAPEADIVCASFPVKKDPQQFPVAWLDPTVKPEPDPYTGLIEVAGAGTGLMRISRSCIERMIEAYGDVWYHNETVPGGKVWQLFENEVVGHVLLGEDINFCRKARAIGCRVYVDPTIEVEHVGRKVYAGQLERWIELCDRARKENA